MDAARHDVAVDANGDELAAAVVREALTVGTCYAVDCAFVLLLMRCYIHPSVSHKQRQWIMRASSTLSSLQRTQRQQ